MKVNARAFRARFTGYPKLRPAGHDLAVMHVDSRGVQELQRIRTITRHHTYCIVSVIQTLGIAFLVCTQHSA